MGLSRALIIPAAGIGSRLQSSLPKVLFPVNGRPMLDYLFALYGADVDRIVLVVRPADLDLVREACANAPVPCDFAVQETPTGMLDAILLARTPLETEPPARVWITWCDQIAIRPGTVRRLRDEASAALALPTCTRRDPYIHLARDPDGRIVRVLHRREGDAMPEEGETDAGLFSLSRTAYFDQLPQFAAGVIAPDGAATRERNFLPFIPWLQQRAAPSARNVHTFACESWIESVGVNAPADVALVAPHLPVLAPPHARASVDRHSGL
jgi:bifunctional N-acetylglucosamine-1-phosphate-uridyltransferase/glucosamine-1-phosphate-acetyltransferase GlmU-like protein